MKKIYYVLICLIIGIIIGINWGIFIEHHTCKNNDLKRAWTYFFIGKKFYEKKQYPEAAEMFNRSIVLYPNLPFSHSFLFHTYWNLGYKKLMAREFILSGHNNISLRKYTSIWLKERQRRYPQK